MTDYKTIHGKTLLHVASDLDSAEGEGQIWFNTTSSDYKTIVKVAGAWATGGSLNTGRGYAVAAGTATAGLCIGGYAAPSIDNVESYDGSSWTEIADLNTGRDNGGSGGTQTAAIVFAGRKAPDSDCLLYTSPSPRDRTRSRMPSSA